MTLTTGLGLFKVFKNSRKKTINW